MVPYWCNRTCETEDEMIRVRPHRKGLRTQTLRFTQCAAMQFSMPSAGAQINKDAPDELVEKATLMTLEVLLK